MIMASASWLQLLAAELTVAPGFLAALDVQLRQHAEQLIGVDDIANGDYALVPPDRGFAVDFRRGDEGVVGTIEGFLVDPTGFGHPVVFGWRGRGAADQDQPIPLDQERDDFECFWIAFPIEELLRGTRVDTSAAAAAIAARFPVDWDVHRWDDVWLAIHAQRAFTPDEQVALEAAVGRVVGEWNAREEHPIHYVARSEAAPDRTSIRWYIDLGAAGERAVIALINALDSVTATADAIARCTVGRRR